MKAHSPFRTLIVDEEQSLRRFLRVTLTAQGHSILEAANGTEALKKIAAADPSFVILDLRLPDKDGVEVIREIRESGSQVPIIVLSARDQEVDKIEALDAGADDYLTKPFSTGELLARMRAVIRRQSAPVTLLAAGKFRMDIDHHSIELDGKPLSLTPIEYEIMRLLVSHAGKVVTRKKILKEIWKAEPTAASSHLLRVTMSKLRDKIEPNSGRPVYILTKAGIGYHLSDE